MDSGVPPDLSDEAARAQAQAESSTRLKHFLEHEHDSLLRALRVYVARAGLAEGEVVIMAAASDLLSEVALEALNHAERFDAARAPMAWVLGIAANLIRRRQTERAKRERREPLVRDLLAESQDRLSDDDLFDQLAALAEDDPTKHLEAKEGLAAMLNRVSSEDRKVLRLAVLNDLNGDALASALHINPGAARVRLHRAMKRLRDALIHDSAGEGRAAR